jgi:hypothetical protein
MEKKTNGHQKNGDMTNKVAMGVGIAALAAATAGAVFLYGTEAGKKKRKEIKGWMLKAKGDVLEKMETMKEWNEASYNTIVDNVASKYRAMKHVDPIQVAALVQDLKSHWKNIKSQVEGNKKKRTVSRRKSTKQAKTE